MWSVATAGQFASPWIYGIPVKNLRKSALPDGSRSTVTPPAEAWGVACFMCPVKFALGTVASGQVLSTTLTVQLSSDPSSDTITNTVAIGAPSFDWNHGNETSTVSTRVLWRRLFIPNVVAVAATAALNTSRTIAIPRLKWRNSRTPGL